MHVGLGATLSRGGALAAVTGLVVLAALAGVRVTARHLAPSLLGAAVAVTALAPSFPVTSRPQAPLAVAGVVAGLAVTLGLPRLPGRARVAALLAGTAAILAGLALLSTSPRVLDTLTDSRVNLASPTRTESASAALRLVADHPLTGVGPGRAVFTWTIPNGRAVSGRYAHNEYLQVLVELGAIGFVLLLSVLVAIALTVRRGRATARPAVLWSGAVAALVTLLVHSGFDFLWQLPVIPLTAALLAGLAGPAVAGTATGPPTVEVE